MAKQKLTKKVIEELKNIEKLELKYLNKYYHFLKFAEDEMLFGFNTKENIRNDWENKYGSKISEISVGAERIVYALLNGKGIGQPNSSPVGADLFFEVEDAYIHIDLKTVDFANKNDYKGKVVVEKNQTSYSGPFKIKFGKDIGKSRKFTPNLPVQYIKDNKEKKFCLTYFITILFDKKNLDVLIISILCMPNGKLRKHYGEKILDAGKRVAKKVSKNIRFKYENAPTFELLGKKNKRIKIVYFNEDMDKKYKKELKEFVKKFK